MHLIFSVHNNIIYATWSVIKSALDREVRLVFAILDLLIGRKIGGWEMLTMFQALYLLTSIIFALLAFYKCGTESLEN